MIKDKDFVKINVFFNFQKLLAITPDSKWISVKISFINVFFKDYFIYYDTESTCFLYLITFLLLHFLY